MQCRLSSVDVRDIAQKRHVMSENGAATALARLTAFAFSTLSAARKAIACASQVNSAVTTGDVTWPQLFTERAVSRLYLVNCEADTGEGGRVVAPLGAGAVFCTASACMRL